MRTWLAVVDEVLARWSAIARPLVNKLQPLASDYGKYMCASS
jgi:hypothetical protein